MTIHDRVSDIGVSETDETTAKHVYFTQILPVFAAMLAATGLTTIWVIESGNVGYVRNIGGLGLISLLAIQIGTIIGAGYFRELYPQNVLFAMILAVSEGVILAPMVNQSLRAGLGMAMGQTLLVTAGIFVTVSIVSYTTDIDFSRLRVVLTPGIVILLVLVIANMFIGFAQLTENLIYGGGVVLFCGFVLYDMDRILEKGYGPVTGAISLYLDFLLIFIYLWELMHGDS